MARPPQDPSLAVIGAGVAGCALVAHLRRLGFKGGIDLWETGRGPGGRSSTRRSRQDPNLAINHGAPIMNICSDSAPALLEPLLSQASLQPWQGRLAMLQGESTLQLNRSDALSSGELYRASQGMDGLATGLLRLAEVEGAPAVRCHFSTLVRHLVFEPHQGWQLFNQKQELIGKAPWLVLSGTLLAHPRSSLILGWPEVPLKQAVQGLGDLELEHALATLAGIRSEARSSLLMVLDRESARPWLALPFELLSFDAGAQQRWGLQRVSIQRLDDGRCAVVAHSSNAFAADHLDVYGSRSAVAEMLGLPADGGREETVIAALGSALVKGLAPWLQGWSGVEQGDCQLMRWGAAFPMAPGLPSQLTICQQSHLGFCGDYIAGPGFGRIEGALSSAENLATKLLPYLPSS